MKILHLTIKKKFFDMIFHPDPSKRKREEYRAVKAYWIKRLVDSSNYPMEEPGENKTLPHDVEFDIANGHKWDEVLKAYFSKIKDFDAIHFYNGWAPSLKYPNGLIECKGIDIGPAVPEWSDNWQGDVFRIKLGEIIK